MIINSGIGAPASVRGEAVTAIDGAMLLGLLTSLCHGASIAQLDGGIATMRGLPADVTLTGVGIDPAHPGVILLRLASAEFSPVVLVGAPLRVVMLEGHVEYPGQQELAE